MNPILIGLGVVFLFAAMVAAFIPGTGIWMPLFLLGLAAIAVRAVRAARGEGKDPR